MNLFRRWRAELTGVVPVSRMDRAGRSPKLADSTRWSNGDGAPGHSRRQDRRMTAFPIELLVTLPRSLFDRTSDIRIAISIQPFQFEVEGQLVSVGRPPNRTAGR